MKMTKFSFLLSFTLMAAVLTTANAQYDDIYFDPSRDAPASSTKGSRYDRTADYSTSPTATADNYAYDDSSFDFGRNQEVNRADNEYDYFYTSRIRRFNRPYYGFDFFDPVYVDANYYDPTFTPGATVLIYDNFNSYSAYNSWNRWNRWNRVNSFSSWGWNPYTPYYSNWAWNQNNAGFNSFNSWDPWYGSYANNFAVNNFYGVGGGGFVSNYYCPPSWGGGNIYNTVNTNNNNAANTNGTYYGPRNSGSTYTPNTTGGRARISALEAPREANNNPVLDRARTVPSVGTPTAPRTEPTRVSSPEPTRTYEQPSRTTQPTRTTTPAPTRTYDQPSRTTQPAPTRTYDTPTRSTTPAPTRTYESPRSTPTPSRSYESPRSYDAPRSTPTPSRSYEAPRSYDSGSSRSSGSSAPSSSPTPARSRGGK